jgi:hypothetical protein
LQVTSGASIETEYTYDNLNRRAEIEYGVGSSTASTVTLTYDLGDRLTEAVDSLNGTITRQYGTPATSLASVLDFMTQETSPQGTINYTPDNAARRTQMSWTATGITGSTTVNYGYDNADNLKTVTPTTTPGSVVSCFRNESTVVPGRLADTLALIISMYVKGYFHTFMVG